MEGGGVRMTLWRRAPGPLVQVQMLGILEFKLVATGQGNVAMKNMEIAGSRGFSHSSA